MDLFFFQREEVSYHPKTLMQTCKQTMATKNYHQMMARTMVMPPVQLNVFSSRADWTPLVEQTFCDQCYIDF